MSEIQTTNWLCEKCGEVRSSRHEENMCARVAELKADANDALNKWLTTCANTGHRITEKQAAEAELDKLKSTWYSPEMWSLLRENIEDYKIALARTERLCQEYEAEIERLKRENVGLIALMRKAGEFLDMIDLQTDKSLDNLIRESGVRDEIDRVITKVGENHV